MNRNALHKVYLAELSQVKYSVQKDNGNGLLLIEFTGDYQPGSLGNNDGIYIYAIICSYYFCYEPIFLILDFTKLNYSWGNTILKSLNFFSEIGRDVAEKEKELIVVISPINENAIKSILKMTNVGNRIFFYDYKQAIIHAEVEMEKYLKP